MESVLLAPGDAPGLKATGALLEARGWKVRPLRWEVLTARLAAPAVGPTPSAWVLAPPADEVSQWATRARRFSPATALLVALPAGTPELAMEAVAAGALDVINLPAHPEELAWRVARAVAVQRADPLAPRVADLERQLAEAQQEVLALKTTRSQLEGTLARLAVADPMTGLANARTYQQALRAEFFRARRFGRALSVMVLEVDHAVRLEQHHGANALAAGLKQVGDHLREGLRETDVGARVGDDLFGVVLVETPPQGAAELAVTLRRMVGSASVAPGQRLTLSIGVAGLDGLHADADALQRAALEALEAARQAGRDRVQVAPPPSPSEPVG